MQTNYLLLTILFTLSPQVHGETHETVAVVRELEKIDVPARRAGLIAELKVRRGQRVSAQETIAALDDSDVKLRLSVANAELKQAIAKAQNEGPIASAEASVQRTEQEARLLDELGESSVYLERYRMRNNLLRSIADLKTAENQLLQDKLSVEVKRQQSKVLEHDISQMAVVSPVEAVVQKVLKHEGEWVQQGDAIATVIRMDRLIVEGFLESEKVAMHRIVGAQVKVQLKLADGSTVDRDGLVVERAAPKVEIDGKFPVWVSVENEFVSDQKNVKRWLLRPGMNGSMTVRLE